MELRKDDGLRIIVATSHLLKGITLCRRPSNKNYYTLSTKPFVLNLCPVWWCANDILSRAIMLYPVLKQRSRTYDDIRAIFLWNMVFFLVTVSFELESNTRIDSTKIIRICTNKWKRHPEYDDKIQKRIVGNFLLPQQRQSLAIMSDSMFRTDSLRSAKISGKSINLTRIIGQTECG